jgi:hypothetical protein
MSGILYYTTNKLKCSQNNTEHDNDNGLILFVKTNITFYVFLWITYEKVY